MVQSLLSIAICSSANSCNTDIGREAARAIAAAYRELSARDSQGLVLGDPLPTTELLNFDVPERPQEYGFDTVDGMIAVKKSNGAITWLEVNRTPGGYPLPVWSTSQMMSQTNLVTRCNYYWNQAGYSEQIQLRETERWYADATTENLFRLFLSRTISGLRQHPVYDAEMDLEHISGRLHFFSAPITPLPPATQVTDLSSELALAAMVNYLCEKTGQDFFSEIEPVTLVSWAPRREDLLQKLDELEPQDLINGNNNQGVLTFWAELAAPMESDDSVPLVRYWVNIDAITGRVFGGARNGSYLGSKPSKPKSIWLNLEPGEIGVIVGKKTETVKNAALSQVAMSKKPAMGKSLILKRHKALWLLKYDPKTGLLWARDNKVWKGAKPSANLRKKIESLTK